ncbi:hypothetical protein MNBD_NITROSPIRAE01-1360 [hydrothermal vent metagenome]|uniref:GntR family transcriptional regulator n=1 Tax=hydrothermal vent metagenome TaxID=652676 RepID=A0A3B1CNZ9_9ZZZZ|nr:GntR family transcriptional regulator [Candidatus Manganitrophaceae bacterium]
MAQIGKHNILRVVKEVDFGIYLDGGAEGEILMPDRYVPDDCEVGDNLECFIYFDSEDRLIATTEKPLAMLEECAHLKVVALNAQGAFLDWGLLKDLRVSFSQQNVPMKVGVSYFVRVYLDESGRLAASAKLDRFFNQNVPHYKTGEVVDLLIWGPTDLGYKAIVNHKNWGVLYADDLFQTLKKGQRLQGFIKKVRRDQKIDLTLQKQGYEKVKDITEIILDEIKAENGFIPLTDKSPPELIAKRFGISKKTFKKAVGALYKKKVITIEATGLRLIGD